MIVYKNGIVLTGALIVIYFRKSVQMFTCTTDKDEARPWFGFKKKIYQCLCFQLMP